MIRKWKKVIAGIISSAMIFSCAGCTIGKNTAYALTVGDYQVKAGVYIYYCYTAINEAKNLAAKENEDLDTEDEKALRKVTLEGKPFIDYVKDKATEKCVNHVAVLKHFDDLGLSLTDEQQDSISSYADANWESGEDMFSGNGISKESIREVMESSYKNDEIFKAYYGEDGWEGVTDEQLRENYIENNARVRYIDMDLHDSQGNKLDDAGKKEIKTMAEDFLKRAKAASDQKKMLEEFNTFQEEYDAYVKAAAGESEDEADDADNLDESSTADESSAADESSTTDESSTADESSTSDSDVSMEDVVDQMKSQLDDAQAAYYEAHAKAAAASDDEELKAEAERLKTELDEAQEAYDTAKEALEESENEPAVTTAPDSDDSGETTTTTTTSPYENENIVRVVTTEEGDKEEDVYYNPSKKCYDWIFNDAKTGVPEIVEDDDTMYVIVRLDIEERLNEDDLWNESNIETVRYNMFSDDLEDLIDSWGQEYEVVKNEKAYKRYDPFDIKDADHQ